MDNIHTNRLAEELLQQAVSRGASDLHIEPMETGVRIRIRIDGLLEELTVLPIQQYSTLITQFKVAGGMDIAEKRLPQDGRLVMYIEKQKIDLRLASIPTINGEKLAVRILSRQDNLLDLDTMSFSQKNLMQYRKLFQYTNGLLLLTGPTGSGKTTTLYATLKEMDTSRHNIMTLEDPVEYKLNGINQVAVNNKTGLSFAAGLKAFVRQDPDIIMLGEIRDEETATMAVHAALTGHLVLSTLHTNNALGAVFRLLDMGIADYLIAAALRGVLAQRLVRRLCTHCRRQRLASSAELAYLGCNNEDLLLWEAVGCEHCHGSGYKGRLAIQELMTFNKPLQKLLLSETNEEKMQQQIYRQGENTLYHDAVEKLFAGETTVQELWRIGITAGGKDA